jgi:REP element-mobilizing transposase RayT
MSTHHQLLYHIVFSTKLRQRWLTADIRARLFPYLAGIAQSSGGYALQVGGIEDHVHLLLRIPAKVAVADAVRTLKANSSKWIHETYPQLREFAWQDGYGAFTISQSNVESVKSYIINQESHHQVKSFEDEYRALMERHQIEFDPRHLYG